MKFVIHLSFEDRNRFYMIVFPIVNVRHLGPRGHRLISIGAKFDDMKSSKRRFIIVNFLVEMFLQIVFHQTKLTLRN